LSASADTIDPEMGDKVAARQAAEAQRARVPGSKGRLIQWTNAVAVASDLG